MRSIIDDITLAEKGKQRLTWFKYNMPVMSVLDEELIDSKPFKDMSIAICMHVEPKTAYWIETLLNGGAKEIVLVGCIGTTKPDTAAYLASFDNIYVYAKENDTRTNHEAYLNEIMEHKFDLFLDNGGSLNLAYCAKPRSWKPIGATEETRSGKLLMEEYSHHYDYPILVIDDSPIKKMLENTIGVGQSVVDGFMRATSLLLGGKKVLVIGYGWCGRGVASKFKGMGAITSIYDVDSIKMLRAKAEGHDIGSFQNLLGDADIIVTVTGRNNVLNMNHVSYINDRAIICNAGHYSYEVNLDEMRSECLESYYVKENIEVLSYFDKDIFIINDANPINLSSGDGNPIEIMDLGLGLQTVSAMEIVSDKSLKNGLQDLSRKTNNKIATLVLEKIFKV